MPHNSAPHRHRHRHIAPPRLNPWPAVLAAAFLLACQASGVLSVALSGQGIVYDASPVRTLTTGNAFGLIGGSGRASAEDLEGRRSRRFVGKDTLVTVRAPLKLAPERSIYPRIEGLAVRFITYKGAWLRSVELIDGGRSIYRKQTQLGGNYWTQTVRTPANAANAWVIPSLPVSEHTVVELKIQFPTVLDDNGSEEGEFVLRDIEASYPRRAVADQQIPR